MFSVTEALSLNTAEVTTSEFSPAAAIVRLGGAGVNKGSPSAVGPRLGGGEGRV